MNVNSLAAVGSGMTAQKIAQKMDVSVAQKGLDNMKAEGQAVMKLLDGAAINPSSGSGTSISVIA